MHIGIDLGGTKTEIIVLSSQKQEVYRKREATDKKSYQQVLQQLTRLVREAELELSADCTIGIGIPGTLSPDHGNVKNANSTVLIGHPLDRDLEALLRRPVKIANDADCFTLSEAIDGAGSGAQSVFGVILGTGVGGGIVINNTILDGPNRICGEWGHNPLPWPTHLDLPARACYCGKSACIETYLSGPALEHQYQGLTAQTSPTEAQVIAALATSGNAEAQQVLEAYCHRLAKALASVINILDPEVIVLGGGLSNIQKLYDEVPEQLQRFVFSDSLNTKLLPNRYGDSSGVRGAAWLGMAGKVN